MPEVSGVSTDGVNTNTSISQVGDGQVMLQTIVVKTTGASASKVLRLLFDSGAQRSYIRGDSTNAVGAYKVGEEFLRQVVFGGSLSDLRAHSIYEVQLSSLDGKVCRKVQLLEQPVLCGKIPRLEKGPWLEELSKKGIWLNDVHSRTPDVDTLIGGDLYGELLTGKICQLKCGLTALETVFGWTVIGNLNATTSTGSSMALSVIALSVQETTLADLWNLETLGINDPAEHQTKAEREQYCKEFFKSTVKIDEDGRYEVCLPWMIDKTQIPTNRDIAQKRLLSTTRKLQHLGRFSDYAHVIEDWRDNQLIEFVPEDELEVKGHYLPHRPVFKSESSTTPIRPVFDASSKSLHSLSLNDCLEMGPNLLALIPSVILKFREKKIGVTADFKKAFMMISVHPEDRNFLRFLWWDPENTGIIKVYRHKRVVFGVNCSPYLLAAVIDYHLDRAPESLKDCAGILRHSLYVDNCVTSVDDLTQFENFRISATVLLDSAKMDLRLWERSMTDNDGSSCRDTGETETRVLGIKWDKYTDTLACVIPEFEMEEAITKRKILSILQKIYDPLGFLTPAMLVPKLCMQDAWVAKLGWDEKLPGEIETKFRIWVSEFHLLSSVRVLRWISSGSPMSTWSLHVFCDASQRAYTAVVFLRSKSGSEYIVRLLQSKSRVAPLKRISIPLLELLACVIGTRLLSSVKVALNLKDIVTYFWTDSTTAVAWIQGNSNWGVFVKNRVNEIRASTEPTNWRHISGKVNPADILSRGCVPSKLLQSQWWEGSTWLSLSKEFWPVENPEVDLELVNVELKKTVAMNVVGDESLWYCKYLSRYPSIIRMMAWVKRFIFNSKRPLHERLVGELSADEINEGEELLIKLIQKECFSKDKRPGSDLRVITDEKGLLRVATKITRRDDVFDFKYPYLLPSSHPVVDALIRYVHECNCHAGVQATMTEIRRRFWILRCRKTVRRIQNQCVRCKIFEKDKFNTMPTPLPADQVGDTVVFNIVGVDVAGPLYLRDGSKVWVVLFTCAVYRAVHLELTTSLSTEGFLQALRRFIARRGRPRVLFSDNGRNFMGTENLFRVLHWKYITAAYATKRIQWKFNSPDAPWWGGWWERLVQMMKKLLLRVLGKSLLYYEQLLTILCDVESVINNRPLTYVSEDSDDLIPLTPSMFLQEISNNDSGDLDHIESSGFEKRLRYRQRLRQDLGSRFRKEYLSLLVQKAQEKQIVPPQIGDVVLIGSDNKKRLEWLMGRILELYPGPDGHTRVAKIKTTKGEIIRPVQKLYLLEVGNREKVVSITNKPQNIFTNKKELIKVERESVDNIQRATRSGRVVRMPKRYK